jgi:hypothetical protein
MKKFIYKTLFLLFFSSIAISVASGRYEFNFLWFCAHEVNAPAQPPVPGKIVINEVLYDPIGDNAGNQLVELKNVGSEPVELEDWWFCARQDYAKIPNVTMAPGEFLVAHIGVNGTNTPTDVFLPFMLTLQSISDLGLYRNSNFTNPGSMVHFVQWGGVPPTNRQSEAVAAGLWTAGEFVAGVAEGSSIEYDGSGNSASDWFEQPNPNIGF